MSIVTLRQTTAPTRRPVLWSVLRAVFRGWRERARSRRELMMLSDRELADIGLTAADVHKESGKPFWQA